MSKVFGTLIVSAMSDFGIGSRERADMDVFPPSLTRQEFAEECDINTLMDRYEKSGVISHVNRAQPKYFDMTVMPDLREALDMMRDASIAFSSLPAKVRREFDNDPQQFVDYAQNPENIDRMREWGLAPPPPVEAPPMKVSIVGDLPQAKAPEDHGVKPKV